jgi:hypothetical protein
MYFLSKRNIKEVKNACHMNLWKAETADVESVLLLFTADISAHCNLSQG